MRSISTTLLNVPDMLPIIKKIVTGVIDFFTDEEDPYDQLRPSFEARIPTQRLQRDKDGQYVDPVIAAKWEKLHKDRGE